MNRIEAQRRARASAGAARITRLRYRAGREAFQIVLEAERSMAETKSALGQALGGGWQA